MRRYIISPAASHDLDEISDYFALHNIDAGERLIENFNKKCHQLAEFPNMGRSYREIEPTLRGVPLSG